MKYQRVYKGYRAAVVLLLILGLGVFAFPLYGWSQAPLKLGYVDMEKAVNDSQAGKDARQKFVAYMNKRRAEAEKKKEDLKTMKQILEKQGALLSEDVRIQKEQEYQQKVREYQLYLKNLRDDARTKEMEMSKKIIRQIQRIIFSYAKKEHYAMIFEKSRSGLLYASDPLDLTDTIIRIYNQEYSKKK
jgi:outer membrane protein